MEQGAPWGDRVIGKTDELHFARAINPETLRESTTGIVLTPHHIHTSIHDYLGLTQFATEAGFGTTVGSPLPLFDPFLST